MAKKGIVLVGPAPADTYFVMGEDGQPLSMAETARRRRIFNFITGYIATKGGGADKIGRLLSRIRQEAKKGNGEIGGYQDGKLVLSYAAARALSQKISEVSSVYRPVNTIYSERLAVAKKLRDEGYDVRVVLPQGDKLRYAQFEKDARRLGLGIELVGPGYINIEWPRDQAFQVRGEKDILFSTTGQGINDLARIGASGKPVKSGLGIGGKVVVGNGIALVHEGLLGDKGMGKLAKAVGKVYALPSAVLKFPFDIHPKKKLVKEDIYFEHSHIDSVIGLANGDHKVMVVDPYYYEKHKGLLREIARDSGHKIVKIAKSEAHLMPANFISLPDGRVLINHAPKLYAQLKKHGVDAIMMDRAIKAAPRYAFGGIRCMTSELKA